MWLSIERNYLFINFLTLSIVFQQSLLPLCYGQFPGDIGDNGPGDFGIAKHKIHARVKRDGGGFGLFGGGDDDDDGGFFGGDDDDDDEGGGIGRLMRGALPLGIGAAIGIPIGAAGGVAGATYGPGILMSLIGKLLGGGGATKKPVVPAIKSPDDYDYDYTGVPPAAGTKGASSNLDDLLGGTPAKKPVKARRPSDESPNGAAKDPDDPLGRSITVRRKTVRDVDNSVETRSTPNDQLTRNMRHFREALHSKLIPALQAAAASRMLERNTNVSTVNKQVDFIAEPSNTVFAVNTEEVVEISPRNGTVIKTSSDTNTNSSSNSNSKPNANANPNTNSNSNTTKTSTTIKSSNKTATAAFIQSDKIMEKLLAAEGTSEPLTPEIRDALLQLADMLASTAKVDSNNATASTKDNPGVTNSTVVDHHQDEIVALRRAVAVAHRQRRRRERQAAMRAEQQRRRRLMALMQRAASEDGEEMMPMLMAAAASQSAPVHTSANGAAAANRSPFLNPRTMLPAMAFNFMDNNKK